MCLAEIVYNREFNTVVTIKTMITLHKNLKGLSPSQPMPPWIPQCKGAGFEQ